MEGLAMRDVTNKMEPCIEACEACHGACIETITHCLKQGGEHAERDHIRLLMDCALICSTAADFMHHGSDFYKQACTLCAEICEACADHCARFGDDPIMRHCEEHCRRCADACREMSSL
jgi:hypothetical protein